ncbi:golgin subfamily A member 1 isoform X1 [Takifugu rubripes]|uniref:Golgin subfamily A member 1 n=2 Tax=Takifugu rubripes TaxID=31033 RepID=H2SXH5_TAKRU|nr:golgin subfamily A member 1 isoform X1 [Takifugu rubripes]
MFAKLKKKIAEEAATAPRSNVRIPRTISKESITSMGADSGDDFASDGSSSRDDLPAQLLRRNDQIRRLEAKLSDYAEQLRLMQKTKDKLELALEKHQDSSIKKLQEQNESHQVNRTRMAEAMSAALEKKDQEWMEKMAAVEQEKSALSAQVEEMMDQSLALFQKRDDLDELEGFQQQELSKVKHMLLRKEEQLQQKEAELRSAQRNLSEVQGNLQALRGHHEESCSLNAELEIEREELLLLKEESDRKVRGLEGRCAELQEVVQKVSEDLQKSQRTVAALEASLQGLQSEHDSLRLQQQKAAVVEEEKERLLLELQRKAASLERRLEGNLSQDEHLQEFLQEKSNLEENLEGSRAELLALRTDHADAVGALEAQVSRLNGTIAELQTLLRHKDDSSKAYRTRTDAQICDLEQQLLDAKDALKQQTADNQQHTDKLLQEWRAERTHLEEQSQEKVAELQQNISALQTEGGRLQERVACLEEQKMEAEALMRQQRQELQQCRDELDNERAEKKKVSDVLEELAQRREELQVQVDELSTSLQTARGQEAAAGEELRRREETIRTLHSEAQHWQEETERQRALQEQTVLDKDSQLAGVQAELDSCQARISYLEVEVETLTEQLQSPDVCEDAENGSVTVDDLDHIQKVNRDLEQQLGDKNRTIKQLQQRLAELRRTLQKELKLKSDQDPEGRERYSESRADKQERVCPDLAPASSPPPSTIMVTNSVDLNDTREINFEYLKHVVLKFMSSRDAEAFQLIRAVSVLLHFTREEEDMLKQTLEYKMSWFGSRPSPKGIIRPSVSGAFTHWS